MTQLARQAGLEGELERSSEDQTVSWTGSGGLSTGEWEFVFQNGEILERKRPVKVVEQQPEDRKGEPLELRQLERPHWPSCFLPGKIERVPVQILVDTGCTTNLLSKRVFDRLTRATRATMEAYDSHGVLADGTRMTFYGLIRLPLQIRHFSAEETFVVGQTDEDVILGMPFLAHQDCAMDFKRQTLVLQKKELKCTDRLGRPLVSAVQVYKAVEVPPRHEVIVIGRVTDRAAKTSGVIEGKEEKELMVAASLVEPDEKGRVLIRCVTVGQRDDFTNPHPLTKYASSTVENQERSFIPKIAHASSVERQIAFCYAKLLKYGPYSKRREHVSVALFQTFFPKMVL